MELNPCQIKAMGLYSIPGLILLHKLLYLNTVSPPRRPALIYDRSQVRPSNSNVDYLHLN
jgi:hypothetical protein